jgi:hypothetical protein
VTATPAWHSTGDSLVWLPVSSWGRRMSAIGLITGLVAGGLGLYLLAIWLIEYDRDYHDAAATRLPVPVLAAHVLAAVIGLSIWVAYLIWDRDRLAWYAVIALVVAAALGLSMAIRWVSGYRARRSAEQLAARFIAAPPGVPGAGRRHDGLGPPERNFPLPVVIGHGAFALVTLTLAVLTALGIGRGLSRPSARGFPAGAAAPAVWPAPL